MSRYTETTNYDLRKPIPNSEETRDKWGTDINRNIINIDQIYADIQAQMNSTEGLTDEMLNTAIPAIELALSTMLARVTNLLGRMIPFLDNPDCETAAQGYITDLEALETWIDAHITRLQRFNTDTYYETVTTSIADADTPTTYLQIVFDNGLFKSFSTS